MTNQVHYPLPPRPQTAGGRQRRLGVELEFTGLEVGAVARLVAQELGGEVRVSSLYEQAVETPSGVFQVELDSRFMKDWVRTQGQSDSPFEEISDEVVRVLGEQLVPCEVVAPPLSLGDLDQLDRLTERLRAEGAQGTRDGLINAFGLHLNPELPDLADRTLTAYLKAFLCLFEWLRYRSQVDFTRRLTLYIDPFPPAYAALVADPDYWPDQARLIDDYLLYNPTRNRALDLLPVFAEADPKRVTAVVDDPRIKPRPALHYRLPNCEIDHPGWGVWQAWQDWLQVEHLANDAQRLDQICAAYSKRMARPLGNWLGDWLEESRRWLIPVDDL